MQETCSSDPAIADREPSAAAVRFRAADTSATSVDVDVPADTAARQSTATDDRVGQAFRSQEVGQAFRPRKDRVGQVFRPRKDRVGQAFRSQEVSLQITERQSRSGLQTTGSRSGLQITASRTAFRSREDREGHAFRSWQVGQPSDHWKTEWTVYPTKYIWTMLPYKVHLDHATLKSTYRPCYPTKYI